MRVQTLELLNCFSELVKQPLEHLGVTGVNHVRVYSNNELIMLYNDLSGHALSSI